MPERRKRNDMQRTHRWVRSMGIYRAIAWDALMSEWQTETINHCSCLSIIAKSRPPRINVNPRRGAEPLTFLSVPDRSSPMRCLTSRFGGRCISSDWQGKGAYIPTFSLVENDPQLPGFLLRDYR